jgi:hypothetical protein
VSELRFQLERAKLSHPGWGLASIAVHVVVAVLLAGTVGTTVIATRSEEPEFFYIGTREHTLPGRARPAAAVQARVEAPEAAAAVTDTGTVSARPSYFAPRVVPVGLPPKRVVSFDPVLGGEERIGSTGYGSGRLWVGPIEAQLGVMGPSEDRSTHAARVDSAVRAKLLAFIDTIPADSFATPEVRPWVTEINGQKWGVDGSWVYLGGLKLPTILLALLPLPQGNYQQALDALELAGIRYLILLAAWQANTIADFRRYVREIRERTDREREERRRLMRRDTIP